jgi:hypothetical protein
MSFNTCMTCISTSSGRASYAATGTRQSAAYYATHARNATVPQTLVSPRVVSVLCRASAIMFAYRDVRGNFTLLVSPQTVTYDTLIT